MSRLTTTACRLLAAATIVTATQAAVAQAPTEDQCIAAFDAGQTLRNDRKLIDARKQLQQCAQAACPGQIAKDCSQWLTEISAEIPSIVVVAKDPAGADTLAVRVWRDSVVIAESIGVDAIELDPGTHQLRFEHQGAAPVSKTVVLRVAERNVRVPIAFAHAYGGAPASPPQAPSGAAQPPPVDSADEGGLSPLFWAGLAVAGVGLIVGAITGAVAVSNKSDIDDRCPDDCTQEDIDDAAVPAHVSTGAFAVAGIGAAMAIIGLLVGSSDVNEPGVTPTASGILFRF